MSTIDKQVKKHQLKTDMVYRMASYYDTRRGLNNSTRRAARSHVCAKRENIDNRDNGAWGLQLHNESLSYAAYLVRMASQKARAMGLYVTHWTQLCI